jgi:hypothetical protein
MKNPLEVWNGIDSEVHRMYMKGTKDWSKKKVYEIGEKMGFGSCLFVGMSIGSFTDNFSQAIPSIFLSGLVSAPIAVQLSYFLNTDEYISEEKVENPLVFYSKKINDKLRLPLLAGGIGSIALMNYGIGEDPSGWDKLGFLSAASYGISLASSMYLLDRDPKVLEKSSVFTRAYHSAKEKLSPTPEPVPIPVKDYETLDNIVI